MKQSSSDWAVTTLPPALHLTAAAPLAASLTAYRGISLMIDGSAVERLGAQCLQVLLAARNAWAADGHSFSIASPSVALAEALAIFGAADLLTLSGEETRP